jgi:flagellar biosynthesis/type III secretory pathway protein FliH
MAAFRGSERIVSPFEFVSLAGEELEAMGSRFGPNGGGQAAERGASQPAGNHAQRDAGKDGAAWAGTDRVGKDAMQGNAIERARQEGLEAGNQEGRSATRIEMEAEMQACVARERARLIGAVKEFGAVRERYFVDVEQEVVKLALGIAERVLHREAQIDPLLLAGVVRVALEKMADRSGVVLRVAQADVEAWKPVFHAMEPTERPRVVEDARLQRGDCVLETKMGTVELGVSVQLKEIEKGFFDLLNHRPVQ